MKKGLGVIIGIVLVLTSYGCIVEQRDDEYGRHHEGYRDHEEHRDGDYERDRDERRDYEDQHY